MSRLQLVALAIAAIVAPTARAALPDITPLIPRSAEQALDVNERIVLPPIPADRFYSVRFWVELRDPSQRPEVSNTFELQPGANQIPVMRYFEPATKYRWLVSLKSRDESQSNLAMSNGPLPLEVKPPSSMQGNAGIQIHEPNDKEKRTAGGDYLLRWTPVPGAKKYLVPTCVEKTTGKGVKRSVTIAGCEEANAGLLAFDPDPRLNPAMTAEGDASLPYKYLTVEPGKQVAWHVKAVDANGIPIAYSPEATFDTPQSPFARFQEKGFSLTGTLDPAADPATNSATIGYSRGNDNEGDYRFYSSKFALAWSGFQSDVTTFGYFTTTASLEGSLNSRGKQRQDDKIIVRVGLVDYFSAPKESIRGPFKPLGPGNGARVAVNAKYETSRSTAEAKRTEKTFAEVRINPLFSGIPDVFNIPQGNYYTGRYEHGRTQIRITPTIGVDRGRTQVIGASEEKGRNLLRYSGKLRVEANDSRLATNAGNITAFAERTWYRLPWESKELRTPVYLISGIDIPLAIDTALSVRYSFGRSAPLFVPGRAFDVGLGVKF